MTKSGSTDPLPPDRLPALLPDLKPVALLTVDGENERMQVHKYDQHVREQKREPPRLPRKVLTAKQKSGGAKPASSDARQRHTERLRLESSRSVTQECTYTIYMYVLIQLRLNNDLTSTASNVYC